jgi:arsenate reductase (glutaredoxin)
VLDGGWVHWVAQGLPTDRAAFAAQPATYRAVFDREILLEVADIPARLAAGDLLIDARAAERFRGEVEPIDRIAGHVPGAVNRPYAMNLSDGRFKPAAQLAEEFALLLGARAPQSVIAMCGSGVTACHHLLAMTHAGLPGAKLLTGSWSGWIEDPARPIATGSERNPKTAGESAMDVDDTLMERMPTALMPVEIWHNPACGTSRNTLALIRHVGIEPQVVDYLDAPPSKRKLAETIAAAGLTVREAIREKGTPYAELGLGDRSLSDDALLDAMLAHPILINRPFVLTPMGVRLCRPSESVLDILPPCDKPFAKEDGEVVLGVTGAIT